MFVISDEIYEHINFIGGHQSLAQFPQLKDQIAVINGVSKAYAMTGWRIGFMAGPEWLAKACGKLQGQYTSGTCSVAQKAAQVAFDGPQDDVESMRKVFNRRRDLIVSLAKEIPGFEVNNPQGAFYLWMKTPVEEKEFVSKCKEYNILPVGGTSFACPGYVRFAYCVSYETIMNSMKAFAKVAEFYGLKK